MGNCSSCDSTHVSPSKTVKLVTHDGNLTEFSYPVRVSYVLAKNPTCFICDADEMEFNDAVSQMNADEELQLGQLYFALPLRWLKRPLQAEEMAALAVKASSALGAGNKCGCPGQQHFIAREKSDRKADVGGGGGSRRGRNNGNGRRKFVANLNAIPE